MNKKKYQKVWILYIVLFFIFSISLYESIHIIPEGSKALVHPNDKYNFNNSNRLGHIKNSGLIFAIPFFQKVRLYTEMSSGTINARKPKLIIVYSYVINDYHARKFYTSAHSNHDIVKLYLSTNINKLIDKRSSNDNVLKVATDVFREFNFMSGKSLSTESFFKEFTIDVKAKD